MSKTRNGIGFGYRTGMASKGSVTNYLVFTVAENQTAVGTITEANATFNITSGSDVFAIDSGGVITFKIAPNFEIISLYNLTVISSKNKRYSINVNITEVLSSFALNLTTPLTLSTPL